MEPVQIPIDITPGHKTLVSAGHSHFSRVADALAEFIDNSIQASQAQSNGRKIELGLDLNYHGDAASYISILDNGEGMDEKALNDFGVYSLDKVSRGLNPSNENTSNISKFGVGAKQAGFFLGDRIHVLTSDAESSSILEMVLDREAIEGKASNDENPFKDYITRHDAAKSLDGNFFIERKFNDRVQQLVNRLFEQKFQHSNSFTLITIRLRREIKRKLHREDAFKDLPIQLADIYHFHLHPENLPNAVAKRTFEK